MIQKNQRTMDVYENAGAAMRLLKTLGTKAAVDVSLVLSSADTDKLLRALRKIDEICSRAEDNMFADHPELSSEYTDVFYGASCNEPGGDVDSRMRERMRVIANELIEGNQH